MHNYIGNDGLIVDLYLLIMNFLKNHAGKRRYMWNIYMHMYVYPAKIECMSVFEISERYSG